MPPLRLTSTMSEAADPFCRELADYLAEQLEREVVFVEDIPWQGRLERLYEGEIDVGWICGLIYITRMTPPNSSGVELLAAPTMRGARYGGNPVYFSDVIVRQDSPFQTFEALRGATWVYNEPESFSGYFVLLDKLAKMGEGMSFFRKTIESGTHLESLKVVERGEADMTAIDSTAFDQYLQAHPDAKTHFRVVDTLGPHPIPPWAVSRSTPPEIRGALRDAMLTMNDHPRGRLILEKGGLFRFEKVTDADYDSIRSVFRVGTGLS